MRFSSVGLALLYCLLDSCKLKPPFDTMLGKGTLRWQLLGAGREPVYWQKVAYIDPDSGDVLYSRRTDAAKQYLPVLPRHMHSVVADYMVVGRTTVLSTLRRIMGDVLKSDDHLARVLVATASARLLAVDVSDRRRSELDYILYWRVDHTRPPQCDMEHAVAGVHVHGSGGNEYGLMLEEMRSTLTWAGVKPLMPTTGVVHVDPAIAAEAPSGRGASFLFRRQVLPGFALAQGGSQFARQGAVAFQLSNAVVAHGGTGFHSTAHVRMYFPSTGRVAVRVNDGSWPLLTNHFAVRVWGHRVLLFGGERSCKEAHFSRVHVHWLWEVSGRSVASMRCVERSITRDETIPESTKLVAATRSPWGDVLALTALGMVLRLHVTTSGYHWEHFSTVPGPSHLLARSAPLVVLGSLLVLHGGVLRSTRSNTTWVMPLEPASHRRWCKAPILPGTTLPPERAWHVATAVDGRLWVWGGDTRSLLHVDDTVWCTTLVEQDSEATAAAVLSSNDQPTDDLIHDEVSGSHSAVYRVVAPRFLVSWTKHGLTSSQKRAAPETLMHPVYTRFGGTSLVVVGAVAGNSATRHVIASQKPVTGVVSGCDGGCRRWRALL